MTLAEIAKASGCIGPDFDADTVESYVGHYIHDADPVEMVRRHCADRLQKRAEDTPWHDDPEGIRIACEATYKRVEAYAAERCQAEEDEAADALASRQSALEKPGKNASDEEKARYKAAVEDAHARYKAAVEDARARRDDAIRAERLSADGRISMAENRVQSVLADTRRQVAAKS